MTSRLLWLLGAVAAAVPLVSLWNQPHLPAFFSIGPLLLLTLSVLRPASGLLAAIAGIPVSVPLAALAGPVPLGPPELAEWWALPVIAGAALREAATPRPVATRLAAPAATLGLVLVASAVVELSVAQWLFGPLPAYLGEAWQHVTRTYFTDPKAVAEGHLAAYWLEGLTLACLLERAVRRSPDFAAAAGRMAIAGLGAAAAGSWLRLAEISLSAGSQGPSAFQYILGARITPYLPDLNATGSMYACGVLIVATHLLGRRLHGLRLAGAGLALVVLAGATWLTGSRAALAAAGLMAGVGWLRLRSHSTTQRWIGAGLALAMVVAVAIWNPGRAAQSGAGAALGVRADMARIGAAQIADAPVFGVGIGQFQRTSVLHITPDLMARFPQTRVGENAHNQFIQIAAEWGLVGLCAWLWLLIRAGAPLRQISGEAGPAGIWPLAVALGWATFLVSSVLGHPLLVPAVVVGLVPLLGLAAAVDPTAVRGRRWSHAAALLLAVAVTTTVPWRIGQARLEADLDNHVVGASAVAGESAGVAYRLVTTSATWFVRESAQVMDLPLALESGPVAGCVVHLDLDRVPANQVIVSGREWTRVRFVVSAGKYRQMTRRLDVRVADPSCVVRVGRPLLRD